jgi:hypothetical protein
MFAMFVLLCGALVFSDYTQTEAVHVKIAEVVLIGWFCLSVFLSLVNMVIFFTHPQTNTDGDEHRVARIQKAYARTNSAEMLTAELEGITMTSNPTMAAELSPRMKL